VQLRERSEIQPRPQRWRISWITATTARWLAAEGLVSIGFEALEPLLKVLADHGAEQPIRRGPYHVLGGLADRAPQEKGALLLEALEGPDSGIWKHLGPPAWPSTDRPGRQGSSIRLCA
jgi:hypothetical protein